MTRTEADILDKMIVEWQKAARIARNDAERERATMVRVVLEILRESFRAGV